ncbi:MAG: EcsC family protein [Candidatus Phosphoribacter baldrii]
MGIFDKDASTELATTQRGALEQAASGQQEGGLAGMATDLVEKLLDVGIDGRGPFNSAHEVAVAARDGVRSDDAAIKAIIRKHVRAGAVGGFVTGLGGFVTMPVALPANVAEFYLVATRMVAAIADVRGYDLSQPQIRTAVLLTLVGADAEDLLKKAAVIPGVSLGTGRLTSLAAGRLPAPALMVVNKAVGFRLVAQAGRSVLSRFGKAVPVIGGAIGAGVDGFLLNRIAESAKREFPRRSA